MSETNPQHGAERNRRQETSGSEPVEYRDARTGETVFRGSAVSHTRTVVERWCAGCECWIKCDGIMGFLGWIAEHQDHAEPVAREVH